MRVRSILLAAVCVAAVCITTSQTHVFAAASGVTAAATGAGDVNFGDGLRTFSFTATASGGRISGEAQLNNRARDTRSHVAVSCLVVSGNMAYVGGTVDRSNNPDLVGAPALFAVQDNGEGSSAAADQITALFIGDSDCTNGDLQSALVQFLFPIQQGNVQVH